MDQLAAAAIAQPEPRSGQDAPQRAGDGALSPPRPASDPRASEATAACLLVRAPSSLFLACWGLSGFTLLPSTPSGVRCRGSARRRTGRDRSFFRRKRTGRKPRRTGGGRERDPDGQDDADGEGDLCRRAARRFERRRWGAPRLHVFATGAGPHPQVRDVHRWPAGLPEEGQQEVPQPLLRALLPRAAVRYPFPSGLGALLIVTLMIARESCW